MIFTMVSSLPLTKVRVVVGRNRFMAFDIFFNDNDDDDDETCISGKGFVLFGIE
jgi:hypothetical protein